MTKADQGQSLETSRRDTVKEAGIKGQLSQHYSPKQEVLWGPGKKEKIQTNLENEGCTPTLPGEGERFSLPSSCLLSLGEGRPESGAKL